MTMLYRSWRRHLLALPLAGILLLISSAIALVVQKDHSVLHTAKQLESIRASAQVPQSIQYIQKRLDGFKLTNAIRQGGVASDGNDEDDTNQSDVAPDEAENNQSDEGTTQEDSGDTNGGSDTADGQEGDEDGGSDGDKDGGKGSATGGEDSSSADSDADAPTENDSVEDKTDSNDEGVQKKGDQAGADGEEAPTEKQMDPFNSFFLMQMVELNSDDGFEQVTIFGYGSLVGPFANSPNTSNIDELSNPNDEAWYTDEAYVDRIAFQFTYIPDSDGYEISEPVVGAGSSTGISPIVEDFKKDGTTGAGSFTVLYRCQRGAPQTSHISLKLQVTANRSVETIWTKKCGSGNFEYLDFGFTAHDHSVMLFNPDGTYGTDEKKTLEIGPLETSTELVMKLTPPAQNLQFLDPYLSTGSEEVSVQLRGTITGGTLSGDSATSFSILYKCETATVATIDFTVAIPPWDNVTAHWRKDCGGSYSQALLIGTTGKSSFDVMQDGELSRGYNVTDDTTLDEANGVVGVVPADIDTKRFYLTNSDDTSDIHIQTITATMSNPEVVTTVVTMPLLAASSIPSEGDVIKRKETRTLSLHFVCKREGKSVVLVTLPTLRYKNIEFGFIKECYEPKVYHHSGFLQTASSLMAAVLVLGVLATIGTCIYYRRRQGAKYTAVPTSDQVIP